MVVIACVTLMGHGTLIPGKYGYSCLLFIADYVPQVIIYKHMKYCTTNSGMVVQSSTKAGFQRYHLEEVGQYLSE